MKDEPDGNHQICEKVTGSAEAYKFEPLHYGPFSGALLNDIEQLAEDGLLKVVSQALDSRGKVYEYTYRLTEKGEALLREYETRWSELTTIRHVIREYSGLSRFALVQMIYEKFPEAVPR